MTRELTNHKVNELNEALAITVLDEPGQGNACHEYAITYNNHNDEQVVKFQNGPIKEFGVNGISGEALLAILEDRLLGFQSGPFACGANAIALGYIQSAQEVLKNRTIERLSRGVEGTNQL